MAKAKNQFHEKDPDASKRYGVNWAPFLGTATIVSSQWTATPAGLTITDGGYSTTTTAARIASGTAGVRYDVVNRVTTSDGDTDEVTMYLTVIQGV